ncbi:unnamed protein product [Rhizophagus irregularis]|uniref:Uncharacterized protein n=1 Tax=Rhizophagus irregularis TaxID=588596 RepID=A0A915YRB7_9GLOM|nr:unnamed protein product [Rhizophagus irregularis]
MISTTSMGSLQQPRTGFLKDRVEVDDSPVRTLFDQNHVFIYLNAYNSILKQVAEERTNHEAENAELRSRIEELENGRTDTVAECEKADMSGEKSLEDKKTDAFLDEAHNKWEEEEKHAIEISPNNDCPNRDIISLYKDTREAKVDVIKSNREFKSMYKDFMANNNAGKKKAKGQVYDLPNAKRKILYHFTENSNMEFPKMQNKMMMIRLLYQRNS